MPVTYEIDTEHGMLRTRCTGVATLQEVVEHFATLEADPLRPARADVLLDLSGMKSLPETPQIRIVAGRVSLVKNIEFGAIAIVADQDALYGMMRMFEALTALQFTRTRVFRDAAAAEEWLRIGRETGNYDDG